jgi:plastocyanin
MSTARRVVALLSLVVLLGVAACGTVSTSAGQASPAPTQPATATAPTSTAGATSGTCPASSGLPADTNMHGAVAASGSQLSIEASDFFFSPTCVTGLHSGTITLTVHNGGVVLHNVSIPQLHIDQDMSPGQTITVVVKMGSTPLVFFCKYHRASGMLGALIPAGS